jgi:hypothetical protein
MRVGFTGTREGMTIAQWEHFEYLVTMRHVTEWHDGDCLGADTQAHATIRRIAWPPIEMHGHPCNIFKWRAHNEYDVLHPVAPPLSRNRHIVGASDLMFATPKEYAEVFRGSGTWATIRYAKSREVPLTIIFPDGSEENYNGA